MNRTAIRPGAHVWAVVEYPTSHRQHTINAIVESHSLTRNGAIRYRVRDHETGAVYIVLYSQVCAMS